MNWPKVMPDLWDPSSVTLTGNDHKQMAFWKLLHDEKVTRILKKKIVSEGREMLAKCRGIFSQKPATSSELDTRL